MNQSKKMMKNDSKLFKDSYMKTSPKGKSINPLPLSMREAIDKNLENKIKSLKDTSPGLHPFKPKMVSDPSLKSL